MSNEQTQEESAAINSQIKVSPILLSRSPEGQMIETWELEYPRFIHSELMTHRVLSRNAASSRAIPIDKVMEQVKNDPAMPIRWGLNQAGMQGGANHLSTASCIWAWKMAAKSSVVAAKVLQGLGLHKQIVNRVMEPFVRIKTVVTATEWANWYYLRNHSDAQPEIAELARMMFEKREGLIANNDFNCLEVGDHHLPYVITCFDEDGNQYFFADENCDEEISSEEAFKLSASCCAQVSYRLLDQTMAKAIKIWDQLVGMTPVHASPFEHQATVMEEAECMDVIDTTDNWQEGVTHMDRDWKLWSGNFKGWIQHRQLIKGHVVNTFEK